MLCGFFISVIGVIILALSKYQPWGNQLIKSTSITISLIGLGIYIIGRIFREIGRQKKKTTSLSYDSEKDNEDDEA
jgi:ABC-type uncharacterized transport system permease subunit